jgi:hypothetical protein
MGDSYGCLLLGFENAWKVYRINMSAKGASLQVAAASAEPSTVYLQATLHVPGHSSA